MSRLMLLVVLTSLAMLALPAEVAAKPRRAKTAVTEGISYRGDAWEGYRPKAERPWPTPPSQELFQRAPLRFKRLSTFRHSTLASMVQRSGR